MLQLECWTRTLNSCPGFSLRAGSRLLWYKNTFRAREFLFAWHCKHFPLDSPPQSLKEPYMIKTEWTKHSKNALFVEPCSLRGYRTLKRTKIVSYQVWQYFYTGLDSLYSIRSREKYIIHRQTWVSWSLSLSWTNLVMSFRFSSESSEVALMRSLQAFIACRSSSVVDTPIKD